MPIEIRITGDSGVEVREEMARLLGTQAIAFTLQERVAEAEKVTDAVSRWLHNTVDTLQEGAKEVFRTPPARERGKPAVGRARRTKEEIAEDEAADKADAARSEAAADAGIQTDNAEDVKSAISTGGERVGPEDSPEVVAQDEADEQAEADANRTDALTHDDLRQAMGRYQKKFGMAEAVKIVAEGGLIGMTADKVPLEEIGAVIARLDAAIEGAPAPAADKPATREDLVAAMKRYALKYDGQDTDMSKMPLTMEDCPKVFQMLFGDNAVKVSDVPADRYAEAVAGIDEMTAKNPFGREAA